MGEIFALFADADPAWASHTLSALAGLVAGLLAQQLTLGKQIDELSRRIAVLETQVHFSNQQQPHTDQKGP